MWRWQTADIPWWIYGAAVLIFYQIFDKFQVEIAYRQTDFCLSFLQGIVKVKLRQNALQKEKINLTLDMNKWQVNVYSATIFTVITDINNGYFSNTRYRYRYRYRYEKNTRFIRYNRYRYRYLCNTSTDCAIIRQVALAILS